MVSASRVLQEAFRALTRPRCLVSQRGRAQLGGSAIFCGPLVSGAQPCCGWAWIGSLRPYAVAGVRQALGARVQQGGDPEISKTLDGRGYGGTGSPLDRKSVV